jgi:hypothetical protein
MSKLVFVLFIFVIILLGVGYQTVQYFSEEHPPQQDEMVTQTGEQPTDTIDALLFDLAEKTGIAFSSPTGSEVRWNVRQGGEVATLAIPGRAIHAESAPAVSEATVRQFLLDEGFVFDIYNAASGTIINRDGYQRGSLVCVTHSEISKTNELGIPITDEMNIDVWCASLNDYRDAASGIAAALAQKYDKEQSAVEVAVSQASESHARGTVRFTDEEGPGNAGLVLGAYTNGIWTAVFDGNGALLCADLETFSFPSEFFSDCATL